jgi:hypothetical protein
MDAWALGITLAFLPFVDSREEREMEGAGWVKL